MGEPGMTARVATVGISERNVTLVALPSFEN